VTDLSTDRARNACASSRRRQSKRALRGTAGAVGFAVALAMASAPAAADTQIKLKPKEIKLKHKETEHISKEPFGKIPKGPLQIIISIDQQKLHLYSDGTQVADALVATGVPDHPTPMGVFSVINKERYHESNIYSRAPMPYMQRITWSGVAMHEGVGVGHPASHGCIRMPREFAARLWVLTRRGAHVIIARPELRPEEFADPHLFVHTRKPTAPAPMASAAAAVEPVKTAQTVDGSQTTDAIAVSATSLDPVGPHAPTTAEVNAPTASEATKPETPKAADENKPAGPLTAQQIETAAPETVPVPLPKPAELARAPTAAPIAVFISRKDKRIYLRQNFSPLFDAPIAIDHPDQRLGTHVFTAMEYLDDGSRFRWNVVSLPGEQPKTARNPDNEKKSAKARRSDERAAKPLPDPAPPPTPQEALARIEIPPDVIEQISQLIVPGSSLIVSDQGLGEETGEGTNFIVVTH
jgi:lipoprotein-anchoring transpeptidase ErfK/SrfK